MACVICSFEFFAALAVVAFGGLAVVVLGVALANVHEFGPTVGTGQKLRVRGFFNPRAYTHPRARLWMGRARWAAVIALVGFAVFYVFAGWAYLGNLCAACPGAGA